MGRVVLLHLLGWCGTHYSTAATARMLAGKPSGFSQPPFQPLPMGTPNKELDKAAELAAAATRQRHSRVHGESGRERATREWLE